MARFSEFNIVAVLEGRRHRLAKVKFARDGTIFVMFPSFAHQAGLAAHVQMKAGHHNLPDVKMGEIGKVASHLVKYTHHPDGEAHFSQDGKVKTVIRRSAAPLAISSGHLFTLQVQPLTSFSAPKRVSPELTINCEGLIRGLKIVCHRYALSFLREPDLAHVGIAPAGLAFPDGTAFRGLFVAPPYDYAFSDFFLFLTFEDMPNFTDGEVLVFCAGFDPSQIALDLTKDSGFLALIYPCSDRERLISTVGSIDFEPVAREA